MDDDPNGNVQHIAEHGITKDEVADVLVAPIDEDISRSSGRPIAFGLTNSGRHIAVVYEDIDDVTVYPITAFELE